MAIDSRPSRDPGGARLTGVAAVHQSTGPLDHPSEASTYKPTGSADGLEKPGDLRWGRYCLVQKVGEGSFGAVYRGWDPELEREVAIKILHAHVTPADLKGRLLDEGRALAKIRHANVVSVHGVEAHGDRVGLCMEFINGRTLQDHVEADGVYGAEEAVTIGIAVGRALAAVHQAGYLHRDVKSKNVMRERAGRIVLMDFGAGLRTSHDLARAGTAGTLIYMAPELLLDAAPASPATDVYALGVLLFYLVTGDYPVKGRSLDELMAAHHDGRRQLLSARRPDLSAEFIRVVARAVAPDLGIRYGTAAELVDDLAALEAPHPSGRTAEWFPARRILRVTIVSAAAAGWIALVGTVTSMQFNLLLERMIVAGEGPVDWLIWGLRSLIGPAINMAQVLIATLLVIIFVRGLLSFIPAGHRFAARLSAGAAWIRQRLGIDDADRFAQLVFLGGVLYLGVVCVASRPIIEASTHRISELTGAQRALLSPANAAQHLAHRSMLDYAVLGLGLALVRIRRLRTQSPTPIGRAYLAAVVALFVLATVLWSAPYRLFFQAQLPRVDVDGAPCYRLGVDAQGVLVYCPERPDSRVRRMPADYPGYRDTGLTENVFSR